MTDAPASVGRAALTAGLAMLLALAVGGCAHTPKVPPPAISLSASPDAEDIQLTQAGAKALIEIRSPRGIGSAWFTVAAKPVVKEICVRLHLRGLEQFRFSQGDSETTVSVASQAGHALRESWQSAGQPERALDPSLPIWIPVQIVPANGAPVVIPLQDGWFELLLPAAACAPGSEFRLSWVDFFR